MKIVVSRCLLGEPCRYDARTSNDLRAKLREAGFTDSDIVSVCPESDGGLTTPRTPSEIIGGDGADVLEGRARVLMKDGKESTCEFLRGATLALSAAQAAGARVALLKAKSPSCGIDRIYDGSFSGNLTAGDGVTVALFKKHGIRVVSDQDLKTLFPLGEDEGERDC